jgi:hypothetical protein
MLKTNKAITFFFGDIASAQQDLKEGIFYFYAKILVIKL